VTLIIPNKPSQLIGLITGEMSRTKFTEIKTSSEKGLKYGIDFNLEVMVRTTAGRAKRLR